MKAAAAAMAIGTFLILGLHCYLVNGSPDTTVRLYQCNAVTYEDSDPYRDNVDYVLNYILTVTANTPDYNLYQKHSYLNSPTAYGHGICRRTLTASDCATCILVAYEDIRRFCNHRIGGKAYLQDCAIRYENYPFHGPQL